MLATGEIWIRVPETIRIEWEGTFQEGVMAKDVMLFLCGRLGMDGGRYQAVEYCGEAVSELSMQERMTLSNMSAELGAQAGLIAPDATTMKWLEDHGSESDPVEPWQTDPDADFEYHCFDADQLEPQVAAPHSPANAASVVEYNDIRPDVLYLGACTGAKLHDLRLQPHSQRKQGAIRNRILGCPFFKKGLPRSQERRGDENPGRRRSQNSSYQLWTMRGLWPSTFGTRNRLPLSTARNFKGRMGDESSEVYLASPMTVASTAITGYISDPRNFLGAS